MSDVVLVPSWLWRAATRGLGLLLLSVAGLALALLAGLADPPRAGPLLWEDDFKGDTARWSWQASGGARLGPRAGALVADFTGPGQVAWAVASGPTADFTLEVAGTQTQGEPGSVDYGLVFAWEAPGLYAAVLVNGSGYVEVYHASQAGRTPWFPLQQWPHVLPGAESNRIRVDVRAGQATLRINDELLGSFYGPTAGKIGLMARSTGPGQVVFSWVRVWGQ